MHEDDRAVDDINRFVCDRTQVVSRKFDEFNVRKIAEPLGGESEHMRRDIGADPAPTTTGQTLSNPTDAAANFQNDIRRVYPHVIEKELACSNATSLDGRFVFHPA